MGLPNPSRETKFSGTKSDREIFIFSVQLTTGRIGNLTRWILTLDICDGHTYMTIHTYSAASFDHTVIFRTVPESLIECGSTCKRV